MEDAIYSDVITLPDGRIAVAHERYDASGQLVGKEYIPQPALQNPATATPICKATMFPDSVAAALGLPGTASVAEGLLSITPPLIAKYETAGAYTWVVPDLFQGKSYRIGVLILGAGGGGGSAQPTISTDTKAASGGASGFSKTLSMVASPASVKNIVVGAGGLGAYWGNGNWCAEFHAKCGGTSSFDGVVVKGGDGGHQDGDDTWVSKGAQCGTTNKGGFGITVPFDNFKAPAMCFNSFEHREILGSGGGATYYGNNGSATGWEGGKNPSTGRGGGNGGNGSDTAAENGQEPGCGGGANAKGVRAGDGADGAVYIYFLGVVE